MAFFLVIADCHKKKERKTQYPPPPCCCCWIGHTQQQRAIDCKHGESEAHFSDELWRSVLYQNLLLDGYIKASRRDLSNGGSQTFRRDLLTLIWLWFFDMELFFDLKMEIWRSVGYVVPIGPGNCFHDIYLVSCEFVYMYFAQHSCSGDRFGNILFYSRRFDDFGHIMFIFDNSRHGQ